MFSATKMSELKIKIRKPKRVPGISVFQGQVYYRDTWSWKGHLEKTRSWKNELEKREVGKF